MKVTKASMVGRILRCPPIFPIPGNIHTLHKPQDCKFNVLLLLGDLYDTINLEMGRSTCRTWPNHRSPLKPENFLWLLREEEVEEIHRAVLHCGKELGEASRSLELPARKQGCHFLWQQRDEFFQWQEWARKRTLTSHEKADILTLAWAETSTLGLDFWPQNCELINEW